MNRNIVAGNWKMNLTFDEAKALVEALNTRVVHPNCSVILGVPSIYLSQLQALLSNESITLAAQNCHHKLSGAFTGEISVPMLQSVNIPYVILGHSERREYFKESDSMILEKVNHALSHDLKVIYCCGEPLSIREENEQNQFIGNQLRESILQLDASDMANIIIAYEPIWAIGTGVTASAQQAQDMHAHIRSLVKDVYGDELAQQTSILYGGSVKPVNASALFSNPDVDGGLVGGASLNPDDFISIIEAF